MCPYRSICRSAAFSGLVGLVASVAQLGQVFLGWEPGWPVLFIIAYGYGLGVAGLGFLYLRQARVARAQTMVMIWTALGTMIFTTIGWLFGVEPHQTALFVYLLAAVTTAMLAHLSTPNMWVAAVLFALAGVCVALAPG